MKIRNLLWAPLAVLLVLAGCQSATDEKDDEDPAPAASLTTASEEVQAKASIGMGAPLLALFEAVSLGESGTIAYDSETVDVNGTYGESTSLVIIFSAYDFSGITVTGQATLAGTSTTLHYEGSLTLGGQLSGSVSFTYNMADSIANGSITVDGTTYTLEDYDTSSDEEDLE